MAARNLGGMQEARKVRLCVFTHGRLSERGLIFSLLCKKRSNCSKSKIDFDDWKENSVIFVYRTEHFRELCTLVLHLFCFQYFSAKCQITVSSPLSMASVLFNVILIVMSVK